MLSEFYYKAFLNDFGQHEPKWGSFDAVEVSSALLESFETFCVSMVYEVGRIKWENPRVKLFHLTDLHPVAPWHVSDKVAYTSVRWKLAEAVVGFLIVPQGQAYHLLFKFCFR